MTDLPIGGKFFLIGGLPSRLPQLNTSNLENNPNYKFDRGDWYWCPVFKGTERQFECHKSITAEMVIDQIQPLLK
jgi:hypothetical protein